MFFRWSFPLFFFFVLLGTDVIAQDTYDSGSSVNMDSLRNELHESQQRTAAVQSVENNAAKKAQTITIVAFLLIAIGGVVYIKYTERTRYNHIWQKDVFNKKRPLKQDDLLEAYLRLGVLMIVKDRNDAGEKLIYLNTYLHKYFPQSAYNFQEILKSAYRNPISLSIVSKWLNYHLKESGEKLQLLYFLAGLSVIDGYIEPTEEKMLYDLGQLLKISPADIRSVVNMYQTYTEPEQQTASQTDKALLLQKVENASAVLNVPLSADMEEIKKAYRTMVKKHHPDRFMGHSKEQQEIAHERFLHIQRAYELLEKYKIS